MCSPDVAFTAWISGRSSSAPHYPCTPPLGVNDCGTSTFVDQTSDASPSVADCQEIVRNIQGTNGEWEVEDFVKEQHQLVQSSNNACKFGVQAGDQHGNVDFLIGSQDIVDIITSAIQMFGSSGKVGAKGVMSCKGDVNGQQVNWGLY